MLTLADLARIEAAPRLADVPVLLAELRRLRGLKPGQWRSCRIVLAPRPGMPCTRPMGRNGRHVGRSCGEDAAFLCIYDRNPGGGANHHTRSFSYQRCLRHAIEWAEQRGVPDPRLIPADG